MVRASGRLARNVKGQDRSCPLLAHSSLVRRSESDDVCRLQALRTLDDVELDGRTFRKRTEAAALNRGEVDEQVVTVLAGDEAESLRVVEPLDGAGCFHG